MYFSLILVHQLYFTTTCNMTRPIPIQLQESIKALFSQNCSLRGIQKIFPDLSLSLLSRYRKKFFDSAPRPRPGRVSRISTQNMNYIQRNLRNGNLDGPKGVQCYLAHMGVQMTLRNIQYWNKIGINSTRNRKI